MPECWKWENGGRIPPFSFVKMNDMGNVRNDRDSAGADIRAGGHAVKTGIRKRDRPDLYRIGSLQNLNTGRKDLTQFLWQLWHNKIDHNTVC